jgi:hypothetical protein
VLAQVHKLDHATLGTIMNEIDIFQRWHTADEAATAAEKALHADSFLALEGKGAPPSESQAREVRRLRSVARALLRLKITLMGNLVDSTVYRSNE